MKIFTRFIALRRMTSSEMSVTIRRFFNCYILYSSASSVLWNLHRFSGRSNALNTLAIFKNYRTVKDIVRYNIIDGWALRFYAAGHYIFSQFVRIKGILIFYLMYLIIDLQGKAKFGCNTLLCLYYMGGKDFGLTMKKVLCWKHGFILWHNIHLG